MKQEKQVKSYTRRTKSGKTVTVKAHTAKYEAANKKDASKKKGAGKEIEDLKGKKRATDFEVGFDDFKEWYNETGSKGDKRVAKALRKQLGSSGYQKFRNFVDDNYDASHGHWKMFQRVKGITNKSLDEMTTLKGPRVVSPKKKALQKDSKKVDSTKSVLKGNSELHRWFKESPKAFSKVRVQKSRMSGDYHIHLADGSGQVYDSKEAANKDAKLLRSMHKEWSAKRPKTKGPATKKSTPTKVDAGKSVMNLPTKGIPAYPVRGRKTKK